MKTRTKIILWTIPLLGIVVTYLYVFIVGNGLNVPWKNLGKPSENISKIIGYNFRVGKLFIYSDSGEMYSLPYYDYGYSIPPPTQWEKDNTYKKELDPLYSSSYEPIKTISPLPPFKVRQIYQFEFPMVEGTNINKFALSEDGNLWYWGAVGSGIQGFFYFLTLAIEILAYVLALFVYVVIILTKRIIRNLNFKRPYTQ